MKHTITLTITSLALFSVIRQRAACGTCGVRPGSGSNHHEVNAVFGE